LGASSKQSLLCLTKQLSSQSVNMSLRKFAILCTLCFAVGVRPVAEDDDIANEGHLRQQCDEDKMPTKEATTFCAALSKDGEACRANGCRQLDLLSVMGAFTCKAKCQEVSLYDSAAAMALPSMTDSPVPQEVKDAVQAARELVQGKATAAAVKVQGATQAREKATKAQAGLQEKEEVVAGKLREAEALETEARATKDKMEVAIAETKSADAALRKQSSDYEAALADKAEKKTVMMQKLKSKKEKEAQWKLADQRFKDDMATINEEIPAKQKRIKELEAELQSLRPEIANLTARRTELSGKRTENKNTREIEGRNITDDYKASFDAYVKDKDRANALAAVEQNAKIGSEQAAGSAKAAFKEYWQKVIALSHASDKKTKAQEEAGNAQSENLEAQFALISQAKEVAQAKKELDYYEALRIKVEGVYEFAGVFYKKLGEVAVPEGGNSMMNVMNLAKDAAMQPCLSSYNVVINAANDIAQVDQTEILANLKAGLTKIDTDRYERFKKWCGNEDFAYWIWGANGLTKVELAID